MDKRKLNWITWSFVVLTVLVLAMMLANTLRSPTEIVLPDSSTSPDSTDGTLGDGGDMLVVEVNPSTVQAAIATLDRPEAYRRTLVIEQIWSGGSGSYDIAEIVRGSWTRTDRTMPDGRVRHTITGPEDVYIWYNSERSVYHGAAGEISADNELPIPTYEEILELDPESITAASYQDLTGVACIYTEAQVGEYTLRYWVSVESGLLVAAEKLTGGDIVYRMTALTVDQTEPAESEFTLPDGTVLG